MNEESGIQSRRDISVILPALNEERTIADCIRKIQAVFSENSIDGEILVADSSTDKTAEIARSLGATVIHPEKAWLRKCLPRRLPPCPGPLYRDG